MTALSVTAQLDTAVFPSHAITDISATLIDAEITLGVNQDNATGTVNLTSMPGAAAPRVRLYLYSASDLIFNGEISPGRRWNADSDDGSPGTMQLVGQGTMAKLRNKWGGTDRTYNSVLPDTDTSTAQNVVEASGIDVSLTSISGAGQTIGTAQDVVIHGGTVIPGTPTTADGMLEFIRLLDKSVVPNYVTFETGAGVVTRLARIIGSSAATFSEGGGGNCWGVSVAEDVSAIVNHALVKGLTIAGIPTEAEASAANSYLPAPFEFNTEEFSSYLIDDGVWAQALADWIVAQKNGVLYTVTWTTLLDASDLLAKTITLTSSRRGLSSQLVFVTGIKHNISASKAITTWTGDFRI